MLRTNIIEKCVNFGRKSVAFPLFRKSLSTIQKAEIIAFTAGPIRCRNGQKSPVFLRVIFTNPGPNSTFAEANLCRRIPSRVWKKHNLRGIFR
jgi:hypothetical protein